VGLRERMPEVRLVSAPPARIGRLAGDSSLLSGGGGGSVGASESSRFVFGAGPLLRTSGSLGRATPGFVAFSFGKTFFRGIGVFWWASASRSVEDSPET
jgi:hypothetical protein